ncbi:MAG: undecaprenyl-phosphate glucose phosphotransferase [Pseudomonadota bacterium]
MIADEGRQLIRRTRSAKIWIQMILDHAVVQSLLVYHTFMRAEDIVFPVEYRVLAVITFLLMTFIYNWLGVYKHESTRSDYLAALMQGWGTLIVLLAIFGFVTKTSEAFSREVILLWSLTGFVGQCIVYFLTQRLLPKSIAEVVPTLIVGGGELGRHIATHLNRNEWIPDQVVGFIDDDPQADAWEPLGLPCLGGVNDLEALIAEKGIRRVYITLPMELSGQVKPIASQIVAANVDVIWAPDIFGVSLLNHRVSEIAGVPLISLSQTPLVGGQAIAKTLMDKILASIALVLLSPLMILTAIAVKLSSPGPILFKQKRHGWDGRILEIYKFRSMVVHEETSGQVTQAKKGDQRITPVGRFIRRTSIDELPQLFNVLGGSMSLVGPRPHAIAHNEMYKEQIHSYMLRHRIKPGLTGLAQVNGFRGETDTLDKMESRVNYDLAYINNWSIWLDIEILFRTVFVLLGKNAY